MTEQTPIELAMTRLVWPLRLTRLGMLAERFTRAFWPVWTIIFLALAVGAFMPLAALQLEYLWTLFVIVAAALIWAVARGVRVFRMPSRAEALDRLDRTLPDRPITALIDTPAIGAESAASRSVWAAHVARMADRVANARAPEPDLKISDRDPYGLRFVAATAFAMALLFGAIWRIGDVGEVVVGGDPTVISGPSWEGWVEPPLYTGLPSLYLNDITQDGFEAPQGSRITMRFYGEAGLLSLRQSLSDEAPAEGITPESPAQAISLDHSGTLAVEGPGGRSWTISVMVDQPPAVVLDGEVSGVPPDQMQLSFTATDDYAVVGGQARIELDPASADRRYGLAVDPEPREALILDLPMPFSGSRSEFTETLVEELAEHPFANLAVTLSLSVRDDAGQIGEISQSIDRLPGRRFFDPLANALIEQRRDILWSRANTDRVAQILRTLSHRPEDIFDDDGVYLMVRTAIRRLESGIDSISVEVRDQVAEILWNAAIELEDGDLADALERLRRAQDRLSEAMRQGASDDEIAQLMDEMRQAMDEYMRELAQNSEPGEDQPDQSGESMELSMNDLDEMLRRIEELMQQGRTAEAQQMLDTLRQMMENMQVTQGEGGDGPQTPGQQAMEGLQDTLRGQQGLSDDSFQELQDQFNPGRPGQPGQPQPGQSEGGQQGEQQQPGDQQGSGQGGENDQRSLAERQEDLRRELQQQSQNIPGRSTEGGQEAQRLLDEAGRAMDEAADSLEDGNLADALDSQSEAMEALREGMGELGRALAQEQGDDPGQGQADGTMQPDRPLQDPLGRQAGNAGAFGSDESYEQREEAFRRARELLDELRRRSSDQARPDLELEYLRRLLDQF